MEPSGLVVLNDADVVGLGLGHLLMVPPLLKTSETVVGTWQYGLVDDCLTLLG